MIWARRYGRASHLYETNATKSVCGRGTYSMESGMAPTGGVEPLYIWRCELCKDWAWRTNQPELIGDQFREYKR